MINHYRRFFVPLVLSVVYCVSLLYQYQNGLSSLSSASTDSMAAVEHSHHMHQSSPRMTGQQKKQMTAVICTYKQPICLARMIQHLRSCPVIAEVRVTWFEDGEPPSSTAEYNHADDTPVIFDVLPNKLSHRFHPQDFRTDAVFSVDVDTYYSCESLALAFDTWKMDPNSAVGFHPRFLRGDGSYAWDGAYGQSFKRNTLFITKGGITHRDVFDVYFQDDYKSLRDLVDDSITAEDILMSFILVHKMKAPIIMVCLDVHSHCNVACSQNTVASLSERTSHKRENITKSFFKFFGNSFQEEIGETAILFENTTSRSNIIWQSADHSVCASMQAEGNLSPCNAFCNRNVVCPSNVIEENKE